MQDGGRRWLRCWKANEAGQNLKEEIKLKKKQILVAAIIASALTLTACSGGSGANDGPAAEGETY